MKKFTSEEINKAIDLVYKKLDKKYKSVGAVFASQLIFELEIATQKPHDRYFWDRDDTDDMYVN